MKLTIFYFRLSVYNQYIERNFSVDEKKKIVSLNNQLFTLDSLFTIDTSKEIF